MTLPSVIGNAKNKQRSAALKKAYTTLYQAIMISTQENGDITEWELPPYHASGMLDWSNEYIGKYFKIISACEDNKTRCTNSLDRICNAENPSKCSSIGMHTALYVLNDGSHIYIFSGGNPVNGKSKVLHILIDTNGTHKPNLYGKDVFTFILSLLNNDKPLQKHLLIQTISRVNRKNPGKNYGMIIDYIGIRDNMRKAMKIYGGDTSIAPTIDDVEQATLIFRKELTILKNLFNNYDLKPFLTINYDPVKRYKLLAKAAEYVFISTEELNIEENAHSRKVSFKTYFLKTVKKMRTAYDICQPSGELNEEESALAQCFMAISGFVRKLSGTSEVDTETMNCAVSKMVEEALKYNQVESILDNGEEEDIFSPEYFEKLSDVKMPATKLELLVKMLRKEITEYSKINKLSSKTFKEMLEQTIAEYHARRKTLTTEEAGEAQEKASEDIIKSATKQALKILQQMNEHKESFRKIGLTFEEKAFYDILISIREQYHFEYGNDKKINNFIVNDKCKTLAKKIKDIIDTKSSFADWLNNQNIRNDLKFDIKICLIRNGYPPQYCLEVSNKVMEQVDNFEENL